MVEHYRLALQTVLAAPVPLSSPDPQTAKLLLMVASFISQLKINGFGATAIQAVKKSKAPLLRYVGDHTPWLVRGLAALFASIAAVGIHWTFAGGTFAVTGLTSTAALAFVYNAAQNFLVQHAWYRTLFSSAPPVPEQAPLPGAAEPAKA